MELNFPILELGDLLITTILFDLSDQQVVQFQSDIVNAIKNRDAEGIVIDISTLDVVDSFMARVINDTAKAARLVGAEVVVCGVQPYVALALVELGRNLFNVDTTFNLEQGIDRLRQRLQLRA
ncbi:STAS domain-containing protein [Marinobacter sediminum]|uniref:STAS domain-containing protein n=1 Tax=Marinobacter sediminum TaxID=256323 RepID=UPI0035663EB0